MELTPANLDALYTAFKTSYNKGLARAITDYLKWCTVIPSSAGIEKYPIALITGRMREWIGERKINRLDGKLLTVRNRTFEHTEEVSRDDLADDQYGFYSALIEAMGIEIASLWQQLATDALANPGKWCDGLPFYNAATSGSTARKFGKSVITNKIAQALSVSSYESARALMMSFCDAAGNPLGLVPTLLQVGPADEKAGRMILKADLIADGGTTVTNVHKDECELLVNPLLTGSYAGCWFLHCTSRGLQGGAVQQRAAGELTRLDNPADSYVFRSNKNLYGTTARGEAVGMLPQLIIGGGTALA